MGKKIGIDLGTTNSVVAFKKRDIEIIEDENGSQLMRSCVNYSLGMVGNEAFDYGLNTDPQNTIISIKRLMGGAINSDSVQEMKGKKDYYRYEIVNLKDATENALAVISGGKQYTPEQVSSEILKKLKKLAEEQLNDEVTHAVISVPAYFNEKQRNATRKAAQLAGLKVLQLISEPTAAAYSYGLNNLKTDEKKTVLVYDFGGGTFDLSVIHIFNGSTVEAAVGGDTWLGGDDIDQKLNDFILEKVSKQFKIDNIKALISNLPAEQRDAFKYLMRSQSELAKIQLSNASTAITNITIGDILKKEDGSPLKINISISRKEFSDLVKPFVQKSIEIIDQFLEKSHYAIENINSVILVGGTTFIPLIKEMLELKFGKEKIISALNSTHNPMFAVAEGAAILAFILGDSFECPDCGIKLESDQNVCPSCGGEFDKPKPPTMINKSNVYYLSTKGVDKKEYLKVLDYKAILPYKKKIKAYTITANQRIVGFKIYEEEKNEKKFTAVGFYLISEKLPINSEITVNFKLDNSGILSMTAFPGDMVGSEKDIYLSRGEADTKALEAIYDYGSKFTRELKTLQDESDFLKFISDKLNEIERIGVNNVSDNEWYKIYIETDEFYEELKTRGGRKGDDIDPLKWDIIFANDILSEFGDFTHLVEVSWKDRVKIIINNLENDSDIIENVNMRNDLKNQLNRKSKLRETVAIQYKVNRIGTIPDIATSDQPGEKAMDVSYLNELSEEIKMKFKSNNISDAEALLEKAYRIIYKYEIYF